MTLSGATTPGQSGSESNSNEEVLYVSQISEVGASSSDGLMSYPGHSLEESYPSLEMHSVYSTTLTDWAVHQQSLGGARGVMVIVAGYGNGDTSSNPGRDWLHFHIALIPFGKVWIQIFSLQFWVNSRTD